MDHDEKTVWNKKYAEGSHDSVEPEALLVRVYTEYLAARPPGFALDVAGGTGRNAFWLARQGWRVKLMDISETGTTLAHSRLETEPAEVKPLVETEVADLNTMNDLGDEKYDLVLVFFYLQRELFPALAAALKPGGLLIYQTYTTEQLRLPAGPHNPSFLLKPGELSNAFRSLEILHYSERVAGKATAELVGRRP
jgi:SAM-dependent methyltransferase